MSHYQPQTNWNSSSPQKPNNAAKTAILIVGIVLGFCFLVVVCAVSAIILVGYRVNQAVEAKLVEQRARREAVENERRARINQLNEEAQAAFGNQSPLVMPPSVPNPADMSSVQNRLDEAKKRLEATIDQASKEFADSESTTQNKARSLPGRNVTGVLPKNVKLKHQFPEQGWGLTALAFTPNGKWLAAWKFDCGLVLFNMQTGEQADYIKDLKQFERQTHLMFTPDGKKLVAAHETGTVSIWDLSEEGTFEQNTSYSPHSKKISGVDISSDGNLIVTCSEDEMVRLYDMNKKEMVWGNSEFKEKLLDVQFIDGTEHIVVATQKSFSKLNFSDGTIADSVEHENIGYAIDSEFAPDSKTWLVSTGHELNAIDVDTGNSSGKLNHGEMIWIARLTPDNKRLLCGCQRGINVWDWPKKQLEFSIQVDDVIHVKTLTLTADLKQLAAVRESAGSNLKIYEVVEW